MLVLTRRKGEVFVIGDNIEVTVLSIRNGEIRIGVRAPTGVEVHRKEIYKRIQEEKKLANNIKSSL